MSATPLTAIHLPDRALDELADIEVTDWIDNHAITVKRHWWTETLTEHGLNDTLVGETIRRADIFALADRALASPTAALTLLWNALAWGSGTKRRKNKARIAAVADDPATAGAVLQHAAIVSRTNSEEAYTLLYPGNRGAIHQLGPSFFTKYLYFAGGGNATHPCAILDQNVALALHDTCGWTSLPVDRAWAASAYDRYTTLLGMWVENHKLGRRDVIERWLFNEGKRIRAARRSDDPK